MARRRKRLPEDPVEARIDALAEDGRGVAMIADKPIRVDGALPGERVRFQYTARHRAHDEGRVETVLEPSPDRVEPRCPHATICGGCSLQHLAPEAQIRMKQERLLSSLREVGGLEPERLLDPILGPQWGYRRKARLGVRHVPKKGRTLVGFREKRGSYVAEIGRCDVLVPEIGARIADLGHLLDRLEARARIPQIEVAAGDDDTTLVFRHLDPLSDGDRAALAGFGEAHGLQIALQPAGPDSVEPLWPDPQNLAFSHPAFDVGIGFEPLDFVQVNAVINRRMVERAVELLEPAPDHRVLDLFCGLGNFTLALARRAGHVLGVELSVSMVERARLNAERNGLDNVEYRAVDLGAEPADEPWSAARFDRVLLDPPRSGAAEVLPLVAASGAPRVLYVSCHPMSLARDADRLVHRHGYRLAGAGVMDMFPHTAHVESMALFLKA
ncbi:MAG: 23S rRNA (uracil(1939)-C(5))-methyltransferase RlmD [Chromatiales bacterium]|jgi:23S rRNA (uracil1939-C5)-methyltransferase